MDGTDVTVWIDIREAPTILVKADYAIIAKQITGRTKPPAPFGKRYDVRIVNCGDTGCPLLRCNHRRITLLHWLPFLESLRLNSRAFAPGDAFTGAIDKPDSPAARAWWRHGVYFCLR